MAELYNFPRLRRSASEITQLSPPAWIDFNATGNEIAVTWASVSGADYYVLQRATQSNYVDAITVFTGLAVQFNDTGLSTSTQYYYRIKAGKTYYKESRWETGSPSTVTPPSDECDFLTYAFPGQTAPALIDDYFNNITVYVPYGFDVEAVIVEFTLSQGASCEVYPYAQESGVTQNDFTNPVDYVVTAENGTTQKIWRVTVEYGASFETDFTAFSFAEQLGAATINMVTHAITITVSSDATLSSLVATFTLSSGASCKVGAVSQVSGVTANNFTSPVSYVVTAENGTTTQTWTVTVSVGGYRTESQAYFNQMTNQPSSEQKSWIDAFIGDLVDGGVFAKLDILYLLAIHTNVAGEALINIISPTSFKGTGVGSPTHTPFEGLAGDGASQYVNTNWSPGGDGVNHTLNSASIGYYCNTALAGSNDNNIYGASSGGNYTRCWPRYGNDTRYVRLNYTGNNLVAASQTDTTGLWVDVIENASSAVSYHNTSSIATSSDTPTGVPDADLFFLAGNIGGVGGWTPAQLGLFFAGGALTSGDISTIKTAYDDYIALTASYSGLQPETELYFSAMVTEPDSDQKVHIDNLITALKTADVWDDLDGAWLFAVHTNDDGEALINMKDPYGTSASIVGDPVFTADEGFAGDGIDDSINLNYNPFSEAVNYALNSAAIGMYCRTDIDESKYDMGAHPTHTGNGSIITLYQKGFFGSINCPNILSGYVTDTSGMYVVSRTDASTVSFYRNSSKFADKTQAAGAIYDGDLMALCRNVGGSPDYECTKQLSFIFAGAGLSETKAIALSDAVNDYMEARGSGVYEGSYEGTPTPPPAGNILNGNPSFEDPHGTGDWIYDWKASTQNTPDSVIEIVQPSVGALEGSYALHTQNQYPWGWPSNPTGWNRCEVVTRAQLGGSPEKTGGYLRWHDEHWWGLAFYLPDWADIIVYSPTSTASAWTSVLQMHMIPNNWNWASCGTSPNPFSITALDGYFDYSSVGQEYFGIHCLAPENPYANPPGGGALSGVSDPPYWIPIAQAENKWIKVVANFIVSPDADGKMKFWVGLGANAPMQLEIDQRGPNCYNLDYCYLPAVQETLMQMGIYKSKVNINLVNQYFDAIRFGEVGTSNFLTVCPGTVTTPVYLGGDVGTINTTTLECEFSSALVAGKTTGTYTLNTSGAAVTLSSPTISGGKLRCTISRAITSSETLTFSYTNSGANPLQDETGAQVQTFTKALKVLNNV